jgi:hypothetical protein
MRLRRVGGRSGNCLSANARGYSLPMATIPAIRPDDFAQPRLERLRDLHPTLTYESYDIKRERRILRVRWVIRLSPDIVFTPTLELPLSRTADAGDLEALVFNLGLVETISYWKAACPRELIVAAGTLTAEQRAWWHDLYLHGLGEFFYRNQIDFTEPDFLQISAPAGQGPQAVSRGGTGSLLLAGGGKDSSVTLDILGPTLPRRTALILNPIAAAARISHAAGINDQIGARRTIDPELLRLNAAGYLNGHTPFSAYLAFLGVLVASIERFRYVVVSNERGASVPQTTYRGLPINHQYSKGVRFEQRFQEYCAAFLARDITYFSFLRPLYDLQVASLFARRPLFHPLFRSCNVGQATDSWCGRCAKCAFTWLSLRPFLPRSDVDKIFGRSLISQPEIVEHLRALLGLGEHVPFECVGTIDEARTALGMVLSSTPEDGEREPLNELARQVPALGAERAVADWRVTANAWGDERLLPDEYADRLRAAIDEP